MQKRWKKYSAMDMKTIRSFLDMYSNRRMTQTQKYRDRHYSGVLHFVGPGEPASEVYF